MPQAMIFASVGHLTHSGRVRAHNEDHYLLDTGLGLAIVADGMGGYDAGEVASRIVVDMIRRQVQNGTELKRAVAAANLAVVDAATRGRGRPEMGATMVAALIRAGQYEIVWVGDSRAYVWAGGQLASLSRDHSVIQKLIDRGSITPEEARNDPRRHMVTQAMGKVSTANLTIGHCTGNIAPGHKLLLCSDGLTAHLDEPELTSIIKAGGDDQALVEQMMQRALDEGGNDNITIVMLTIGR